MLVAQLVKIGRLAKPLLKTLPLIVPLLCAASFPTAAQTTATIDIDTTVSTPITPGFSGVSDDLVFPIEYWDYHFNSLAAQIGYGWVRFPGGNTSDIYNWQTGEQVADWLTQFGNNQPNGTQASIAQVAGRGGAKLLDAANRASFFGASLIICANGFTDTPQSIGQLAAYVKANNINVAAWELSNEPYLYPSFFPTATAYLDKMKPYRDAIKAVDPNAIIAIFTRDPGNSGALNAWDTALAAYPNKYWDAITFHHYPPQSSGAFAQWMADESAVLVNKTTTVVTNQLTPIGPPGVKFLNTEFDSTIGTDSATGAASITDGTLWGGIYAAEYTMRMSTVPSMLHVGPNEIVRYAGVFPTHGHEPDAIAAANAGQPIDTASLDFGFYIGAQAYGQAVLNGVINHASQSNKTTVTGGAIVPATGIPQGIPALYAMSYTNPTSGLSVVITNKSATAQQVTIRMNGAAVTGILPLQFVTGTDPSAANTSANTTTVTIQSGSSGNPVTVGPYSVVRVDLMKTPFSDLGQSFSPSGNSGSVNLTFPSGFSWTASSGANWLTITSSPAGTGSGTLNYQLAANTGADRTATITVSGFTFTIEQEAATIPGLASAGSLGQVASEGGWDFSLIGINLGASAATARFTFADNNGSPLMLPLTFPQLTGAAGPELASTLDRTLNPSAQIVMESKGPDNATPLAGSGQLLSNGSVSGFGIFSNPKVHWNAVVPLETRNASKYIMAFDNTGALTTGLAVANLAALQQNVQVIIRDDAGNQIGNPVISLGALGHTSFMLNDPNLGFPVTNNRRGTLEFETPLGGQISVLGLRVNGAALTTLPVLADVGTSGGSITHVAYNGGWTRVFYIVNTGSSPAQFTLSFVDENGVALPVPLLLPQSSTSMRTSALTQTLAAGAMLVVNANQQDSSVPVAGSAQLTTTGNISGFEIFRWNTFSQEASVPLETRTPKSFLLVFDNTNGLTTGVALANLSGSQANITVTLRDDTGAPLPSIPINLLPRGHLSFLLPDPAWYPASANKRGIVEFAVPPGGQISVIGLRAKSSDGTLTTIPVLIK